MLVNLLARSQKTEFLCLALDLNQDWGGHRHRLRRVGPGGLRTATDVLEEGIGILPVLAAGGAVLGQGVVAVPVHLGTQMLTKKAGALEDSTTDGDVAIDDFGNVLVGVVDVGVLNPVDGAAATFAGMKAVLDILCLLKGWEILVDFISVQIVFGDSVASPVVPFGAGVVGGGYGA